MSKEYLTSLNIPIYQRELEDERLKIQENEFLYQIRALQALEKIANLSSIENINFSQIKILLEISLDIGLPLTVYDNDSIENDNEHRILGLKDSDDNVVLAVSANENYQLQIAKRYQKNILIHDLDKSIKYPDSHHLRNLFENNNAIVYIERDSLIPELVSYQILDFLLFDSASIYPNNRNDLLIAAPTPIIPNSDSHSEIFKKFDPDLAAYYP